MVTHPLDVLRLAGPVQQPHPGFGGKNSRWCEMRVRGNRAKARRFYERQKKREGG